jgi:hypothetical protein
MENIVYDNQFNGNEWLVVAFIVIGFAMIQLFPRTFSPTQTAFNLLFGIVTGLIFDHTIAVPPFDLYDLGDQSKYQLFDIFSYVMYAPFGYWFIYIYERLCISGFFTIWYSLAWCGLGMGIEFICVMMEVFHYKNGYQFVYSFPIYLLVLSTHLWLYRITFAPERRNRRLHGI